MWWIIIGIIILLGLSLPIVIFAFIHPEMVLIGIVAVAALAGLYIWKKAD